MAVFAEGVEQEDEVLGGRRGLDEGLDIVEGDGAADEDEEGDGGGVFRGERMREDEEMREQRMFQTKK